MTLYMETVVKKELRVPMDVMDFMDLRETKVYIFIVISKKSMFIKHFGFCTGDQGYEGGRGQAGLRGEPGFEGRLGDIGEQGAVGDTGNILISFND